MTLSSVLWAELFCAYKSAISYFTDLWYDISMKLSKRLNAVKEYIPVGSVVADIGADRGELSYVLIEEGVSPHVILADISKKSIARAERLFGGTDALAKAEFRVGDGLRVLRPGEADMAVFAGMGGPTICSILEQSPDVVSTLKGMIIQSMGNSDLVRRTLMQLGFCLKDEIMIEEEGQFCTILYGVPGKMSLDEIEVFAGPFLLKKGDATLKQYLLRETEKATSLLKMLEAKGEGVSRQKELRAYLTLLKAAAERMIPQ